MAKVEIPKYNDPYVGEVYGNLLDRYDNASYNLKMYMLSEELTNAAFDTTSEMTTDNEELTGPPGEMLILAQTGVTGATLDGLTIESFFNSTGENPIKMNFKVTQPGAASFLDQIHLAKAYLGHTAGTELSFFMEILFTGYTADIDDNEEGGQATQIAGPFRYALKLAKLGVTITEAGSEYEIDALIFKSFAYTPVAYTLPADFTTKGTTITEHVKHLEKQLNEFRSESTGDEVPDEFEFDLSKLIGSGPGSDGTVQSNNIIQDDKLKAPTDKDAEDTNRAQNTTQADSSGDAVEDREANEENVKDEGDSAEARPEIQMVQHKEGTTFTKVFETLLSMNDEYYTKITRKDDISDPSEEDVKQDQAFVSWFKINAEVSNLKFDPSRNVYAKKYQYIPRLILTTRTDVAVSLKETQMDSDQAQSRLEQIIARGGVKKAYHYFFTGLNDQIKSLDITYDNGVALLFPPKGGFIGDFSTTEGKKLKDNLEANEDASLEGEIEKQDAATLESLKRNLFGFIEDVKKTLDTVQGGLENISDEFTELLDTFSETTGIGADRLRQVLEDKTGASTKALLDEIGDKDARAAALNLQIGYREPLTSEIPEDYDPKISAFQYSVDLTNPLDMNNEDIPFTVDDLEKFGFLRVTEEQMENYLSVDPQASKAQNQKHGVSSGTYKVGDPRNTLFGTLATQHANDIAFLINLDIALRGDPWYLGNYQEENATEEYAAYNGESDNHFFLTLRAPIAFDPDFTDEDSELNSGYWRYDGTSRTFSGLYRIVKVINSFDSGNFTTEVNAQRIIGADKLKADKEESTESSESQGAQGMNSQDPAGFVDGSDPIGGNTVP